MTPRRRQTLRGADFVVRQGTFFQVGDYPDKQFSLTEAEADAAIARFAPVPLNIEHIPTIFDGKLGMVRRLWRDGKNLLAEYAIPRWLHDVTRGEAIKISSEWSRTTKSPQGGAFVLHPRVADAVMLAAFHQTAHTSITAETPAMNAGDKANALPDSAANGAAFALGPEPEEPEAQSGCAATANAAQSAAQTQTNMRCEMKGETMSLLSGLKALFQRAGVPASEIDAQLSLPNADASEAGSEHGQDAPNPAAQAASVGNASCQSAPNLEQARFAEYARFAQLEAELARLREESRQAQEAQHAARFAQDAQAIETLVRGGQMTPAEADAWQQIARDKPAAFAVVLPALSARPRLPHTSGATVRASQSHDADRLETLTRQRMRDKGLDHAPAFREICGENKELALSVRAQSQEGS